MSGFPQQSPFSQPKPAVGNPFAEQINPYAAPQNPMPMAPVQQQGLSPFAGLWRQGNLLVMHKNAPLPDICLKSNLPATRRLTRKLSWHNPLLALTVLIAVPLYIILALVLSKRATIQVPLNEE